MLDRDVVQYRPNETARLVADPELQRDARGVSIRALARKARLSTRTVKAARKGEHLQKSTVYKLRKSIWELLYRSSH